MLQQFIKLLDEFSIPAACSVDYGRGQLTILSKQFDFDIPKGTRLTSESISNGYFGEDDLVKCCIDRNWRTIDSNGMLHIFNSIGEYIGPASEARTLIKLGVSEPRIATSVLGDNGYETHKVCTVGYSDVLKKFICWHAGNVHTANSMEEAARFSCMNSIMTFRSTLDLREALCRFLDPKGLNALLDALLPKNGVSVETAGADSATGKLDRPEIAVPCEGKSITPTGIRNIYSEIIDDFGAKLHGKSPAIVPSKVEPTPCEFSDKEDGEVENETDMPEAESGIYGDNSNVSRGESSRGVNHAVVGSLVHKRTGEHRQHRTGNTPSRQERSRMPQSGDHKQHNIPKISENPGYRMPMVEMGSESATKANVLAYSWHKFVPTNGRAKNFKGAHRSYDLRLETGDVFGYRVGRNKVIHLLDRSDTSVEFKITQKDIDLLLKSSKPFKGKVDGTAVNIVKAVKAEVAPKKQTQFGGVKELYVGFFQSSIHVDEYDILFDTTRKNLVSDIEERATRIKQSVPRAIIVKLPVDHTLVKTNINVKHPKMLKAMADHLINQSGDKPQVINFSKRLQQYSQRPKMPRTGGVKPKEPVYAGNDVEVLIELRDAIIRGHYSAEYRPASITASGIKFLDDSSTSQIKMLGILKNPVRLTLAVNNVSPLFKNEAEDMIARIQRDYPTIFVKSRVGNKAREESVIRHKTKTMTLASEDYSVVIIALRLPKRGDSDVARSRKLHELTKNMGRVESITALLKSVQEGQTEINNLVKKMETDNSPENKRLLAIRLAAQKEKANAATELSKTTLILNAPVYAVKKGNTWLTVEVVDFDIYKGTVTIRQVRGGNRLREETTELWTYSGHKQIL